MQEHALVIIKPDAVLKDYRRGIERRYEQAGLTIVDSAEHLLTRAQAMELYKEHAGKHFFEGLTLAMSSGMCVALMLCGDRAIEKVRTLNGHTDPRKAEPGTIRHDFPSAGGPFNVVHASDSREAVERERALFFP